MVLDSTPPATDVPEITRDELLARLRDPALIVVDVLAPESYQASHIAGSINLPLADIDLRARELLPDRAAEIAVYCGSFT